MKSTWERQRNLLPRAWKEYDMERSDSLSEFARQNGEIKASRLAARKVGRRTIITAEDAKAWQEQLPKVQPGVRAPMGMR
jgi:hypothetical protein